MSEPTNWAWTSPPVSTVQVHDPAGDRVLVALIYPNAAAAQAGRLQALDNEPEHNPEGFASTRGPHLVVGYGESTWHRNVALVQTTQSDLDRIFRLRNDCDNGVLVDTIVVPRPPDYAVDVDFQQALDNSIVWL